MRNIPAGHPALPALPIPQRSRSLPHLRRTRRRHRIPRRILQVLQLRRPPVPQHDAPQRRVPRRQRAPDGPLGKAPPLAIEPAAAAVAPALTARAEDEQLQPGQRGAEPAGPGEGRPLAEAGPGEVEGAQVGREREQGGDVVLGDAAPEALAPVEAVALGVVGVEARAADVGADGVGGDGVGFSVLKSCECGLVCVCIWFAWLGMRIAGRAPLHFVTDLGKVALLRVARIGRPRRGDRAVVLSGEMLEKVRWRTRVPKVGSEMSRRARV